MNTQIRAADYQTALILVTSVINSKVAKNWMICGFRLSAESHMERGG